MPRKEKKYNFIYKITCIKNGRFYIGMHSTDNLEDGYLGGGKIIKNSIKKYGKDLHKKEILEFLENRESLAKREREIVNENLINESLCMNLCKGGHYYDRGWTKEDRIKALDRLNELWENPEWKEKRVEKFLERLKNNNGKNWATFKGLKHKDETKKIIGEKNSIAQKGEKNSQFGTFWITNGMESKKIHKDTDIPKGWRKGRVQKQYNYNRIFVYKELFDILEKFGPLAQLVRAGHS